MGVLKVYFYSLFEVIRRRGPLRKSRCQCCGNKCSLECNFIYSFSYAFLYPRNPNPVLPSPSSPSNEPNQLQIQVSNDDKRRKTHTGFGVGFYRYQLDLLRLWCRVLTRYGIITRCWIIPVPIIFLPEHHTNAFYYRRR